MLLVAVTLALVMKEKPQPYMVLGVVLGLLFLSRLDNVFLVGCVVLGLFWRDRDWKLGIACVCCAAVASIYIASNLANFGHLVPISGAIKSSAHRGVYWSGNLGPNGLIGLVGALGLVVHTAFLSTKARPFRVAMLMLSCGVLVQTFYVWALTYGDTTWVWYYVQGYLCLALLVAEIVDRLKWPGFRHAGALVLTLSLLVSGAIAYVKFVYSWSIGDPTSLPGSWKEGWLAETRKAVPDDRSVLIVFDQPGLFAYATSHPVFAIDGLTANYRLDEELKTNGMYPQLAKMEPAHFIAPLVENGSSFRTERIAMTGTPEGQIVHFFAPLDLADAGCVRIDPDALIAQRPVPDGVLGKVWGIWKLTADNTHPVPCPADA